MQNFLSWAGRIDQQGEERHARRQCGHQYRSQSFKCTANDKVRTKGHAFMQGEVDVVRNLEDAVACRDPGKGHEADHPDINIACTGMLESPSWFSDGGGASVERAADALNRPGSTPKLGRNLAHPLCAPWLVQSLTDSAFQLGCYGRPPEPFCLVLARARPRQARTDRSLAPRPSRSPRRPNFRRSLMALLVRSPGRYCPFS